jgi:hypothetical protein
MRTAIAAFAIASALFVVPSFVRADPVTGPASVAPAAQAEVVEARAQVEATIAQMRATSLRVRDQLRTTRRRGTKQQITCVDEALSRSDVALRRAREMGDEALAAYAHGDVPAARAARSRLVEIKEAQRVAAAAGSSCAARPANALAFAQNGVTTVKLEVDATLPPGP